MNLKNLLFSTSGKISMTKLGVSIVVIAGIVTQLPVAAAAAGIAIVIPQWVISTAWIISFIGAKIGVDGLRNALDKNK